MRESSLHALIDETIELIECEARGGSSLRPLYSLVDHTIDDLGFLSILAQERGYYVRLTAHEGRVFWLLEKAPPNFYRKLAVKV